MREPWFWREDGVAAKAAAIAFAPASWLYDLGQRLRAAMSRPQSAGAPVICVGNATLGGVGKTPFALTLQKLLAERGVSAHFQSRGHGGSLTGPVMVHDRHTAIEVGDEALLLARAAPTWVAKNRLAGARAAADGADVVIMDDGFQNPTIRKDFSVLLVDAADPAGNNQVFPAGPLREPMARAVSRADAIALIGEGEPRIDAQGLPVYRASTAVAPTIPPQKVVAFCGIGRPARFFASLEANGFTLVERIAFPDHHPFTPAEFGALAAKARKAGAALIATEKDLVRLSPEQRDGVATVKLTMTIDDPDSLARLALAKIKGAS